MRQRCSIRARRFSRCTRWAWEGWLRPFLIVFISWLPWALATPFVIELARRCSQSFEAGSQGGVLASGGLRGGRRIGGSLVCITPGHFQPVAPDSPPTFVDTWSDLLLEQIVTFVIAYALILAATYVVDSREKMARQLTETARLNQSSRAQLAASGADGPSLHVQHPELDRNGPRPARRCGSRMIVGFERIPAPRARKTLTGHRSRCGRSGVPAALHRHPEGPFRRRLRVSIDIPDELLAVHVPSLLLQPLVENAIKHGVSKRRRVARFGSRTGRDGCASLDRLQRRPWAPEDMAVAPHRNGLGNLRTRLRILHGDRSSFR